MIDFRNINTLWGSIIVETLSRLGLTTAVICPGSRSTPLTFAFAQHPEIESIPILDERSAAFFALGIAKKTGLPVALVCTSGTAGANFYPAVIEAKESRVPLLILTADRPIELRHCHAGQTIDQIKLYGYYPNWQIELATPEPNIEMLAYLRQTIIKAWQRTMFPVQGVVHINLPFREPLAPIIDPHINQIKSQLKLENFWQTTIPNQPQLSIYVSSPWEIWQQQTEGIIIAGLAQNQNPGEYCLAIARLAEYLGFPVLAEALSPVRNYLGLNSHLISTYDLILRNHELAEELAPKIVIQIGELPTSKELRNWLSHYPHYRWIIDPHPDNFDPLHGQTIHLPTSLEAISKTISQPRSSGVNYSSGYLNKWCDLETKVRQKIEQKMEEIDEIIEPKVAWLLSQTLPFATPLFVANSMPVRHMEFFWQPKNSAIIPYFNRGANGIDGTLSTALGIAHRHQSTVMLTGDLALLHDTNGFLIRKHFSGHLTIILVNNNGGGIFEMLPIANFQPPFEEYFATPQNINFGQLAATYNLEYHYITSWQQLKELLNPLPKTGIRLLELPTDRKKDAQWLQANLKQFAANI